MAHTYSHLYDISTTGLRFFTVYGPWGRPDMALFLFVKSALEGKKCGTDLPGIAKTKRYEPVYTNQYQQWYEQYQKPAFEQLFTRNKK